MTLIHRRQSPYILRRVFLFKARVSALVPPESPRLAILSDKPGEKPGAHGKGIASLYTRG